MTDVTVKTFDNGRVQLTADAIDRFASKLRGDLLLPGSPGYDEARIHYARRKMDQIVATGAKTLVVPCHSCHGQLNNIKGKYDRDDLEVKYLWELVADCLIMD